MSRLLTIRTSNSIRTVIDKLIPGFEHKSGYKIELILDTARHSLARILAGERADVVLLLSPAIETLAEKKIVDAHSCQWLARSNIGIGVLKGATHPDILTVEAFKNTLLNAHSICHTEHGPSGSYFPTVLKILDIVDTVRPKCVTRPGGYIGGLVASGEAQLAFQQICELLAVPGIEVVGPIPAALQVNYDSKGAVFQNTPHREAGEAFLRYLRLQEHAPLFQQAGFTQLENTD
jgi:molybdate transport system substrate-binding protein